MTHNSVKDTMKTVRGMSSDDILAALGLERRRKGMNYFLPVVGYFAAGLVIGSGVTLLMAPKSGRQVRRELTEKARGVRDQLGSAAEKVTHEVQGFLSASEDKGREESPVRRAAGSAAKA